MKEGFILYEFTACPWKYEGKGGWYFVSLPVTLSQEIRTTLKWQEEGWGRMKAIACIGESEWETAIWFDSKKNTYILPLKAEIRKKEQIGIEKEIEVSVWV